MRVKLKDSEGVHISINTDGKNYKKLIGDLKQLGKKYESLSNPNKLDFSTVINFQRNPYMRCKGWTSRVVDPNGRTTECFFADYDNCLYRIILDEMRYMMDKYNMPPAMVFKSSDTSEHIDSNGEVYGSYCIVSIGKYTFKEIIDMQNELHIDEAFKTVKMCYRFRTSVLRLGPKGKKSAPVFKCIIGDLDKFYDKEASRGHLEVLKEIYPEIPDVKYTNLDNGSKNKIFVAEYITSSL